MVVPPVQSASRFRVAPEHAGGDTALVLLAGRALLILALAIALYGIVASLYGARTRNVASGAVATGAPGSPRAAARCTRSPAPLRSPSRCSRLAFLRSDFSFELVATHSSTTTPAFYRATAVWSSQEGSLLLWVVLLSGWSSAILFITRRRAREIAPYATAVLLGLARLLLRPARLPREPVRPAQPGAGGGHRAEPAPPPPEHDDPPADALLGVHAVHGAVRVRRRRARDPAPRAEWIRTTRPFALAAWLCLGIGDRARRALVLRRAGLGRVLGLGRRRERRADAVAHRHRLPALGDDPGAARDAEGLERLAGAGAPASSRSSGPSSCARGSSSRSTPSAPRRSGSPSSS